MVGLMNRLRRLFQRDRTDCREVRERASDYLEEELSLSFLQRFRQHLQACPNCNIFVATLRATVHMLRNMPPQPAPADLKDRVRDRVRRASGGDRGGGE